jgi:cobalamin-dependent methionine synthase I
MANNLTTVIKSAKHEVSISRDKGMVVIGERINPTGRNAMQAGFPEPMNPHFWSR